MPVTLGTVSHGETSLDEAHQSLACYLEGRYIQRVTELQ